MARRTYNVYICLVIEVGGLHTLITPIYIIHAKLLLRKGLLESSLLFPIMFSVPFENVKLILLLHSYNIMVYP